MSRSVSNSSGTASLLAGAGLAAVASMVVVCWSTPVPRRAIELSATTAHAVFAASPTAAVAVTGSLPLPTLPTSAVVSASPPPTLLSEHALTLRTTLVTLSRVGGLYGP